MMPNVYLEKLRKEKEIYLAQLNKDEKTYLALAKDYSGKACYIAGLNKAIAIAESEAVAASEGEQVYSRKKMSRYQKIGLAVNLTEKLFCKLHCVTHFDYELDWQDLRVLRLFLIKHIMGDYKFDLIDLSDAGLDQLLDLISSETARCE